MQSGYKCNTQAEVAVPAANSTLHLLGVAGNANFGIVLKELWIDFDGVASGDHPLTIFIARCTFATNPPGTNSTSVTVKQSYGRHAATGFAAARNWTAAPTVIETQAEEEFSFDPNKGVFRYAWPLGEAPDSALGEGWLMSVRTESGDTTSGSVRRAGLRFTRV